VTRRSSIAVAVALAALAAVTALATQVGVNPWRAREAAEDDAREEAEAVLAQRSAASRVEDSSSDAARVARPDEVLGVVVGPRGFDPRTAYVDVQLTEPSRTQWATWHAEPDAAGRFRVAGIVEGASVLVRVFPRDKRVAPGVARSRAGGPPVRIVLEPTPSPVAITVLDSDGKAVRSAEVRVRGTFSISQDPIPPGPEWWQEMQRAQHRLQHEDAGFTDAEGRCRLVPPPHGWTATVSATAPTDRDDIASVAVAPFDGGPTTVRFASGTRIEGLVQDEHGVPLPEAGVVWRLGDSPWQSAKVQYDGTFTLSRAPPGAVTLVALGEPADWRDGSFVVPDDAERVVVGTQGAQPILTVDMGESLEVRIEDWPRDGGRLAYLTRENGEATATRPRRLRTEVSADGIARFRRLDANARYAFWACPASKDVFGDERDARCAYRTGLTARSSPATVRSVIGIPLDVRLERKDTKPRWVPQRISIDDRGVVLDASIGDSHYEPSPAGSEPLVGWQRFEFRAVPEGAWAVTVTSYFIDGENEADPDAPDWTAEARLRKEGAPPSKVVFVHEPPRTKLD
jgi:hypothetical protein